MARHLIDFIPLPPGRWRSRQGSHRCFSIARTTLQVNQLHDCCRSVYYGFSRPQASGASHPTPFPTSGGTRTRPHARMPSIEKHRWRKWIPNTRPNLRNAARFEILSRTHPHQPSSSAARAAACGRGATAFHGGRVGNIHSHSRRLRVQSRGPQARCPAHMRRHACVRRACARADPATPGPRPFAATGPAFWKTAGWLCEARRRVQLGNAVKKRCAIADYPRRECTPIDV